MCGNLGRILGKQNNSTAMGLVLLAPFHGLGFRVYGFGFKSLPQVCTRISMSGSVSAANRSSQAQLHSRVVSQLVIPVHGCLNKLHPKP